MDKQKILILANGEQIPVIAERGKYWVCEGRQFRKLSKLIQRVEEVEVKSSGPAEESKKEEIAGEKPKKKKSTQPSSSEQEKKEEA